MIIEWWPRYGNKNVGCPAARWAEVKIVVHYWITRSWVLDGISIASYSQIQAIDGDENSRI